MGKKQGCQLHGEPSQSVTMHCRKNCIGKIWVEAGDIYNGGKEEATQEAIEVWNKKITSCAAYKALTLLQSPAVEWRPIETAPRDGTMIIVALFMPHFESSDFVMRGIVRPTNNGWSFIWCSQAKWNKNNERWHDGVDTLASPNFWKPLEFPPAPEQEGGG
jgi:hypothetical protein